MTITLSCLLEELGVEVLDRIKFASPVGQGLHSGTFTLLVNIHLCLVTDLCLAELLSRASKREAGGGDL